MKEYLFDEKWRLRKLEDCSDIEKIRLLQLKILSLENQSQQLSLKINRIQLSCNILISFIMGIYITYLLTL